MTCNQLSEKLFVAIRATDLKGAEEALRNGEDVNSRNQENDTPLHEAALKGAENIVKLLVSKGATVDARDSLGCTPLIWASSQGHLGIVDFLLANGADINAKGKLGNTSLHEATRHLHRNVTRYLIENGADVKIPDESQASPLDYVRNPTERSDLAIIEAKLRAAKSQADVQR